jgi:predicted nicotinamide N-methyase
VKNVDVSISNTHSLRVAMPASEDEVLDYYIARPQEGHEDPFFCAIWPSSLFLARALLATPALVAGKRVVDVGCGLGVAGVAAALAGAQSTMLCDRNTFACSFALLTAAANGLFPTPLADTAAAGERQLPSSLPHAGSAGMGSVSALELDWHTPPAALRAAFDVMLCADVLYDATAAEPVAALALHLLAPGGTLVLADNPTRTPAHRERFLAAVAPHFTLVREERDTILDAEHKPAACLLLVLARN